MPWEFMLAEVNNNADIQFITVNEDPCGIAPL
jgi:hypothetical protein